MTVATKPRRKAWRYSTGDIVADWIETHCVLPTGDTPGAPFILMEWQRDWLDDGAGFVVVAETPDGTPWGAAYWYVYKGCAYYGSGAYRARDGVAHLVVWESLMALRTAGYMKVDMGAQGTAQDDKGKAIEFFKRGWGGVDVPVRVLR